MTLFQCWSEFWEYYTLLKSCLQQVYKSDLFPFTKEKEKLSLSFWASFLLFYLYPLSPLLLNENSTLYTLWCHWTQQEFIRTTPEKVQSQIQREAYKETTSMRQYTFSQGYIMRRRETKDCQSATTATEHPKTDAIMACWRLHLGIRLDIASISYTW